MNILDEELFQQSHTMLSQSRLYKYTYRTVLTSLHNLLMADCRLYSISQQSYLPYQLQLLIELSVDCHIAKGDNPVRSLVCIVSIYRICYCMKGISYCINCPFSIYSYINSLSSSTDQCDGLYLLIHMFKCLNYQVEWNTILLILKWPQ